MKSKRIISGLLALTFVFGGIVVPSNVVNNSSIISASAGNLTTSGDFTYSLLNDGTYEIYDISTNLRNNVIHAVIPSEFNGKDVTSISESVFNQCNFTSVEIPDTITKISYNSFYGCENLKSIVLPDSITEIEDSAFQNCKSLESVTLNEGLENIGAFAFQNCKKLKSIEIPSSVNSIGDKAFYDCEQLTKVHISEGKESLTIGFMTFYNCIKLTDINIPDRVVDIGNYAFEDCTGLESISLPDSLKDLGYCAFMGCSNLKNVNIPKSLKAIPQSTFSECIKLTNITIPDNIEEIGSCAFRDCTGFTNFTIPDNITKIGSAAFSGCTGLTNIKIPDKTQEIGSDAFSGCTKLTNVFIPEGVTAIGYSAFCGCTGLKYIWIPASVESIGDYAFSTEYKGEPLKNVTIFCYPNVSSCALEYAKAKGLKYKVIDKITTYPTGIKYTYNEQYHQVKFTWEPIANVQQYGVAIYLAGKWRVQTQNIPASATSYITPKNSVFSGSTYYVAIAAKVNGTWDTANAIKNAVTVKISGSKPNNSGSDDTEEPYVDVGDAEMPIDCGLINDDGCINGIKYEYPFDDPRWSELRDQGGQLRTVNMNGNPISYDSNEIARRNELVYKRARKFGRNSDVTDARFTITPSFNSDFAFTITDTEETKFGIACTTDDYKSTVRIYNTNDNNHVTPLDIKLSDVEYFNDGTKMSKKITYYFALEAGKTYSVDVNNSTNKHKGTYEIHVSEDNWVYAPNGAIRTFNAPDHGYTDFIQVFYTEQLLNKLLNYQHENAGEFIDGTILNRNKYKMTNRNAEHLADAISNFYTDPDERYAIKEEGLPKKASDFFGEGATFVGLFAKGAKFTKFIGVVGAVATASSIYLNLVEDSGIDAQSFNTLLYDILKDYNSEKNLVYTRYTDSSDLITVPLYDYRKHKWERWTSELYYVNKYYELEEIHGHGYPASPDATVRCFVAPVEIIDLDF